MDKVRHMAAGAVQHVVGRTVVGASGHCEREEAEDETRGSRGSNARKQRLEREEAEDRLLQMPFQAGWIYQLHAPS